MHIPSMKRALRLKLHRAVACVVIATFLCNITLAQSGLTQPEQGRLSRLESAPQGDSSLTIYNDNFAVVRQSFPLDLKQGTNAIRFSDTTATLEPDTVILRDAAGKRAIQVLEQSFRNDPATEQRLLSFYEGKVIDFEVQEGDHTRTIQGKVIRSGYVPNYTPYSQPPQYASTEPIIEVDGKLRFGLPGKPLFPDLGDDAILKPQLQWLLRADEPGPFQAELSYISGGLRWQADYNLVAPEKGDTLDLVGWVTFTNDSGKTFNNAQIKLLAGDVNKLQEPRRVYEMAAKAMAMDAAAPAPVSEKAFDEFHLYTLNNRVTLRDHETKQVEFVRAMAVKSQRLYIYDGADLGQYSGWDEVSARSNPQYGTSMNTKVWVEQEFKNSDANHLGIALPKGKVRFYRRNSDGQLEFTGENQIDHTPKDETIRLYTGNAFDLVGERRRTSFHMDSGGHSMDESFEIKLRNHKKEAAEIRVVEHLYRWSNWQVTESSDDYKKTDDRTIEYRVQVPPDSGRTLTYTVHYSW